MMPGTPAYGNRKLISSFKRLLLGAEQHPWPRIIDFVVTLGCVGGMAASVLLAFHLRTSYLDASDFKTLYASVWSLAHHRSAYDFANLEAVFRANGVATPPSWYARAPVYPPTTLALLSPVALVGMVTGTYVFLVLSTVLMSLAVFYLLQHSRKALGFGSGFTNADATVTAVACAALPIVSFSLYVCNLSLAASALSILACVLARSRSPWLCGALLAIALLLKPHLAVWVLVALLVLPEARSRSVGVRATLLAAGLAGVITAALAWTGTLKLQVLGLLLILQNETASGASMNAASREVLPIVAQVPSLKSAVGFWISQPALQTVFTWATLGALAAVLIWRTRSVQEDGALPAIAAWSAFGLLATYHRAHDAILLVLALPWAFHSIWSGKSSVRAWLFLLCVAAGSFGPSEGAIGQLVSAHGSSSPLVFVCLRQSALAILLALVVLLSGPFGTRPRVSASL